MKKPKTGRNEACPCGSGKKYKKCHGFNGSSALGKQAMSPRSDDAIKNRFEEMQATELQRQQQQGLGRQIISWVHKDQRFAVGSRLYYSRAWKTFHDFLISYLPQVMGTEWGNGELQKPFDDRHPIIQWYGWLCDFQKSSITEPGKVHSADMTGAVAAYLSLAYNLYLLAHNVRVQGSLTDRLKDKQQFQGALYETYVAAAFIKAGFEIDFENETDASTTHCEFTAKHGESGRLYSVEAKARQPGKSHSKISSQLYNALKKKAAHRRVVFIDVNVPEAANPKGSMEWLEEALTSLRGREATLTIEGAPAPEAYVFVTNHPYHYNPQAIDFRKSALAEGFKIPDFKLGTAFPSIRDALAARKKHADMFHLMSSLQEHYDIPSTFDGDIPELAFNNKMPRLKIGQKYAIPMSDGTEVVGILTGGTVAESEGYAWCTYALEDGRAGVARFVLTAEELLAYRRHPDTFFGVHYRQPRSSKTPLEMFDFFYETYKNSSHAQLLDFLESSSDYDQLQHLSQEELAIIYCERSVYSMMRSGSFQDQEGVEPKG